MGVSLYGWRHDSDPTSRALDQGTKPCGCQLGCQVCLRACAGDPEMSFSLAEGGEPPRNRTGNLQIKSLLLCQLS